MKLSNATLRDLPDPILRPSYDRSALTPGILHVGLGNFHRAHQSWYLHRLMQQGLAEDWAIVGAGVRPNDEIMRETLKTQDYLTTLIELDPSGTTAEVVGSMIDYVPVEKGNGPLIERMAQPDIRIVSLTITEGGYFIDPETNAFDAAHPDMVYDASNPHSPNTAFGAMVAALRQRRDARAGPFTCQSCDNLQGNGAILRQTVVSLALLSDPELADWIDENCTFPNAMVDFIVPATGPEEHAQAKAFTVEDAAPVSHENFRQWVIEDRFCQGRPDWDKAGALFSDDVERYEAQKIRILNAGHQVIANPGELLSIETISGCMEHPQIGAFFHKVVLEEIVPHVEAVPAMQPTAYVNLVTKRLSNSAIRDTTRRVAFDGSSRHTGFVLPSLRDGLAKGCPISGLALVEANWARMCEGTREDGSIIEANDPFWSDLTKVAKAARDHPRAWLEQRQFYGNLVDEPRFAGAFEGWLQMIWADGVSASLNKYLYGQH